MFLYMIIFFLNELAQKLRTCRSRSEENIQERRRNSMLNRYHYDSYLLTIGLAIQRIVYSEASRRLALSLGHPCW
jgi:hypothetical protein